MKVSYICLALLALSLGCKKGDDPPVVDQGAKFILQLPLNNTAINSTQEIEVVAYMENGKVDDYSHLDYYLIKSWTDTLAKGKLNERGQMNIKVGKLPKGAFDIFVIAIDSRYPEKVFKTEIRTIYVCEQQKPVISFEKDDVSITVKWTRAMPASFKSYEIYVTRTDTMKHRQYERGKKLATITNIDELSFKDASVNYYYKYAYELVVVSQEDCGTASGRFEMEAGTSIRVPGVGNNGPLFSRTKMKWYTLKTGVEKDTIQITDAQTLETEKVSIARASFSENSLLQVTDDALVFKLASTPTIKIFKMDLTSHAIQPFHSFDQPANTRVLAVVGDRIIYSYQKLAYELNVTTGTTYTLPQNAQYGDYLGWAIDQNTYMIAAPLTPDSMYVYRTNAGSAPSILFKDKYSNNGGLSDNVKLLAAGGKVTFGKYLFDASFNIVGTLPGSDNYFTGLSNDGIYVSNNKNQIMKSADLSVAATHSDAYTGSTYFSADNKTIYLITYGSLNLQYNPPSRMFRYPWMK